MKTNNNLKIRTNTVNQCSYFDRSSKTQVTRKGNREIAITESELVSFFGITWRKLNHRPQTIMTPSNLHSKERAVDEEEVATNGPLKGYAPLYLLPITVVLLFLLDNTEAHLLRKYICQKL